MIRLNKNQGFSLIELLVVISFISVMILLILNVGTYNNKLRLINEERTQALFYASEATEAVRLLDWDTLVPGDYSLVLLGDTWTLNPGSQLLDNKYTRNINIDLVDRASFTNGHVYGPVVETGYADANSRKVTVTIDWPSRANTTGHEELETYIYRWQADRWTQTDWSGEAGQDDWVLENKFATRDAGIDVATAGVATLMSGFLDWDNATTTATYSLLGSTLVTVNDVFEKDGRAYVATASNSGDELYIFDVSDVNSPLLLGGYNLSYSVNAVVVKDNYAYLATSGSNELLILDVATPNNITQEGAYDLIGDTDALDIAVGDTEVFIIRSNYLYAVNISDPANPILSDDFPIDDSARAMFLSENYVYVAAYDDNKELQIFDVNNPENLGASSSYDIVSGSTLTATDIYVLGNNAYVSTQSNSNREFFIFDVSDPSTPILLGSYEVGYNVYAFSIVGPYAILGVNNSNEEIIIIDVSFPATINKVKGFNLKGAKYLEQNVNYPYALVANCSNIYFATSNANAEFAILSTQESDCGYADSGVLESSTFDTGYDEVVYNWIAWDGSEPADTDIRFQVASSNDSAGPWNFVGPDGTSSTYYTNSAQEFINYTHHENQRYFRYKLFLSSQAGWQVPILEAVTISYSAYP